MRPTAGTMLQQNNNNNYPCLNVSGSTRDMLQKCSRASLPFPGRMELGLGDLPLIRELRAWALCSKNRRRAGGQAPIAPPAGRGGSSPCSQPGDVYLSGEWGCMGYGLPLGLDGGALVTVATLKTSEGSGKTQTQCLFLRTEKGSYLYSTAKPGSAVSAGAASSVVGGWLRGKTRSRDTPAGRRDNGPAPQAQTGANRVRVRSGRRWRKSCNAAGREKTGASRELRGSGGEDPAGEIILEERQEEGDKGDFPRVQCRSPRSCHDDSPKACRAESPRRGVTDGEAKGMKRERQKNEEEVEPNPESLGGCDAEAMREADDGLDQEDFSSRDQDLRKPGGDEEGQDFSLVSNHHEDVSISTCAPETSAPLEGSTCDAEHQTRVWWEKEKETEHHTVNEDGEPQLFYQNVETSSEKEEEEEEEEERHRGGPFRCEVDQVEAGNSCKEEEKEDWRLQEAGDTCARSTNAPSTSITLLLANPAPSLPPLGSMATGLPCLEAEKKKEEEEEEEEEVEREGVDVTVEDGEGGQEGKRELEEPGEEERSSTVATEEGRKEEEEEEEDEFGVFMQAEGESAWSEGSSMSASVPCGSRGSVAPENHATSTESTHWTPGWTDSSFHQSDDTWAAFPQDSSDDRKEDAVGQWWPTSAVEQGRDRLLANQNLALVFAEAFPSLPASSSSDLAPVPTLTHILRGGADQDQGLLDSFHDLNKMICQRYKRANGVSRDLLLKTLHLEPPPHAEVRPAPRTANRRLSPGLPSANQHAQNAAAKRRLSYDYNRNIME